MTLSKGIDAFMTVSFILHCVQHMNLLSFNDCIKIGAFRKPHGTAGTLDLVFEPEWEASVEHAELFITETDGLPVPWFVAPEGVRITSSKTALINLDWIDNMDSAKRLCGSSVFIPKSKIIPNLKSSELSDWVDFSIYNEIGALVGKVNSTENYAGNLVMMVETPLGEKMVPLHPDLIIEINHETRIMTMVFPEGLLDI
jgi:16S rRNA processing protein RimM